MKHLQRIALACIIALTASGGEMLAQFRYGFQGGAGITANPNEYEKEKIVVSNMFLGLRGEYTLHSNTGVYIAPVAVYQDEHPFLEIPLGAKYHFYYGNASPYAFGGLAIAFRNSADDVNFWRYDADASGGLFHTRNAYASIHAGFGVELGAFDRNTFTAEMRFKKWLVPTAYRHDYLGRYSDELAVVFGFLWR